MAKQTKKELVLEVAAATKTTAATLVEARLLFPSEAARNAAHAALVAQTGLDAAPGLASTSVAVVKQTSFVTPRGRHDIELTASALLLHGKSFKHTVQYANVQRLYLLAHPNGRTTALVIQLVTPLRHGQTRYPFVTATFSNTDTLTLDVKVPEGRDFGGKLQPQMTGPAAQVVPTVLRAVSGAKLTLPKFEAARPSDMAADEEPPRAVACFLKSSDGFLYPLNKGFFFIHKPVTHVRHSDIASVRFDRLGTAGGGNTARNFSLTVKTMAGDIKEVAFTNVDRREYAPLFAYCRAKSIYIEDAVEPSAADHAAARLDDEAEEAQSQGRGSRAASKAATARIRTAVANGEADVVNTGLRDGEEDKEEDADSGLMDDEGTDDDQDFVGGASSSDVEEEFDENYESEGDGPASDDDAPAAKRARKE